MVFAIFLAVLNRAPDERRGDREADLPGLRGVLLQHGLHGLQLQEVLAHVRVQDHLDAERAKLPELAPRHVGEDVAVVLLDGPVGRRRRDGFALAELVPSQFFKTANRVYHDTGY